MNDTVTPQPAHDPESINEECLQEFKMSLRNMVSDDNLAKLEATTQHDALTKKWVQIATVFFYGRAVRQQTGKILFYHPSPVRHLLAACVPRKWAVKLGLGPKTEEVVREVQLLCPHLKGTPESHHLRWLSLMPDEAVSQTVLIHTLRSLKIQMEKMRMTYQGKNSPFGNILSRWISDIDKTLRPLV